MTDAPSILRDRLIRFALHRYWRMTRGMTLGVRAIVIDDAERIFLVRHTYMPGWHLPGGGVEPGETALEALARELDEEGNITFDGPPELHGVFFNRKASNRDHVIVYRVREFRQSAPRTPDAEIAESGFFALDALPEGVTLATRRRIAEDLEDAPTSVYWSD